jgi:hypothetical protein
MNLEQIVAMIGFEGQINDNREINAIRVPDRGLPISGSFPVSGFGELSIR